MVPISFSYTIFFYTSFFFHQKKFYQKIKYFTKNIKSLSNKLLLSY